MKHQLRIFTPAGMSEFQERWSTASEAGASLDVQDMIENTQWTKVISTEFIVEVRAFANRKECGEYFDELFDAVQGDLNAHSIDPAESVELWTWLSALWGKWLQQKDGKQLRLGNGGPLGEKSRWVFEPLNRRRYYRHLLAGPYLIVAANRDEPSRAQILLYNDVVTPNTRWVETICGSEEVVTNKKLLSLFSQKLLDPQSGKPTAAAKALTRRASYFKKRNQDEAGNIDRLTQVYNQLARTWDLTVTDLQQMKNLFGDEFMEFFPDVKN
jgi:hypothetical protein